MEEYEKLAADFLEETQFHLGDMITEKSHPKTRKMSQRLSENISEGLNMLLSVDEDISHKAKEVFLSESYLSLKTSMMGILKEDRNIFFSGCGSTGRLAILLETIWRRFWNNQATVQHNHAPIYRGRAERSCSIMTGGDRALIRSVENFEDYSVLGRRQTIDNGVSRGDLFIAVSEGGETSSVIGTALEAADLGAKVFFLYNNPDSILIEKLERSRMIITDPRITTINLTTGPMALSGSTRMQATTMELFILATAMEDVCSQVVNRETGKTLSAFTHNRETAYLHIYDNLLSELRQSENLDSMSKIVEFEELIYRQKGLITYISDTCLLDIFSDTTERSPTFMLPPFKKSGDNESVQSWAFAKDPFNDTKTAWNRLLQRVPRGLNWTSEDYRNMHCPSSLVENPHKLDLEEIYSYPIGKEKDKIREERGGLVYFDLYDSRSSENRSMFRHYYSTHRKDYAKGARMITLGKGPVEGDISIDLEPPATEMYAFWHIMFKIILNTVSTGTMGRMGRIRGNWMIQVDATNKKLIDRSCRIISSLTGVSYKEACLVLFELMEKNKKESLNDNRSYVVMAIEQIENRN